MDLDIGTHLKAVRQLYGMSQRELAKRAGVTNGLISLIEQNRVSPSVSSLKKVLDGVPMTLADFFTLGRTGRDPVFFPGDTQPDVGSAGLSQWLVGSGLTARSMTVLREKYAPGMDTGELVTAPAGERSGIVVRGSIELHVAGDMRVLVAGDGYYFRNTLPHRFHNPGRNECEIFSVTVPASI